MLSILTSLVLSEIVFALIGGAVAALTFRWWRGRPWVAVAYGLVGVGLFGMVGFLVVWLAPAAELAVPLGLISASILVLIRRRAWVWWRAALPAVLLTAGVTLVYLGLFGLWGGTADPFALATIRFGSPLHPAPVDNQLPWMFESLLSQGKSTHAFTSDWNGSDRPPLLAGLVALMQPLFSAIHLASPAAGFGPSVAGELLWVPAVYAFARAVVPTRSAASYAVLVAGALGTTLNNTLYTWPKITSAALVIASIVLLIDLRRRGTPLVVQLTVSVLAFILGALAHGAAAFAAPLLLVLGLQLIRPRRLIPVARGLLPAFAAALVLYLPWTAYQRYADPPGDRLLKWHLAGVIPIDSRTFLQTLRDSYAALTPAHWISGRIENLVTVFSPEVFTGVLFGFSVAARRSAEFFYTSAALSTTVVVLVIATALVVSRTIRGRTDSLDRITLTLILGSILCLMVWCLVIFLPGWTFVHVGSQVWLFVLAVTPCIWLWQRARRWAWVALVVEVLELILVYVPNLTSSGLFAPALVTAVLGLAVIVVAFLPALSPRRRQARVTTP